MTTREIAELCWARKDEQTPDATVIKALGLDGTPTVRTHGEVVTWRYYDCLRAWLDLVKERATDVRGALPARYRLGDQAERVRIVCARDGCENERDLLPWERARGSECCSVQCAAIHREARKAREEAVR